MLTAPLLMGYIVIGLINVLVVNRFVNLRPDASCPDTLRPRLTWDERICAILFWPGMILFLIDRYVDEE